MQLCNELEIGTSGVLNHSSGAAIGLGFSFVPHDISDQIYGWVAHP
jgi:hypothetical protein